MVDGLNCMSVRNRAAGGVRFKVHSRSRFTVHGLPLFTVRLALSRVCLPCFAPFKVHRSRFTLLRSVQGSPGSLHPHLGIA